MYNMLSIKSEIVKNCKARRKESGLSQKKLAKKSGVSFGSIKRFENKGDISLSSLIKIAISLECESDFKTLFSKKIYRSIDEVINEKE